jgi:integrase
MPTTFVKEFSLQAHGGRVRLTTTGRYYAEYNRDGKTRRKAFDKKKEAVEYLKNKAEDRDKGGSVMTRLTANQTRQAIAALEKLKKFGLTKTLPDIVDDFIERENSRQKSWTLKQCYNEKLKWMEAIEDGVPNCRPRSIKDYKLRLASLLEKNGNDFIPDLTSKDIKAWLVTTGASGRNLRNMKTTVQGLLNFAETNMPGGAKNTEEQGKWRNNIAVFPQAKAKEVKPAEILLVKDCETILRALECYNPRYALAMALGCFAGLRTTEIHEKGGLCWEHIRFDEGIIHIPAALAKTRDFRDVKISENLKAWLKRYKQKEGRISPAAGHFSEKRAALCRDLNLSWPHNGARHSFGTYYAKLHGYRNTSDQLGHTGGIKMLKQHYSGLCTNEEAEAYFNIRPLDKAE